ncbi:PPE family protein [Mycobacterium sp.]|uniref:PPE family protein n=1 Tax=Mycobacterium sp. TaxID=1785 RepID=UPI003F995564
MTNPHFAWLPPEINSALMFAGPGSGPLLAAAAAWNELASELASSAASFGSVTSDLASGSWLGPTSAAMMVVASQYSTFLIGAAAQAEEAASQAGAAAAAFESALAATVQPAVVAANRALMQVLANTNFLGQNAPAIADIEAAYEQMWALDVSAMAGYHFDASAAAERLAPWRQILHALGTSRAQSHSAPANHHHIGLATSVAASSLSNELASALFGNGNGDGNSNLGPGNAGSQNVGAGNAGSHNIGFGNLGNSNIGFGNTGNGDIGFGLTGDHQVGFGGFNSGSGNIGFGNSGTGNIGFFNSGTGNVGIGNSGSFNTGLLNSGSAINGAMNTNLWGPGLAGTGLAATPHLDANLLNSGNYVTGGLNAANLSSSVLNPSVANAAFNPGFATPDVLSAAPASPSFASAPSPATATYDMGTPNPVVSATSGQNATTPLLRTAAPTGFFGSGGNDAEARSTAAATRDAGVDNSGSGGIPSSDFYKSDRGSNVLDFVSNRPGPPE